MTRTKRCPVCRAAFIHRDASMCRPCFDASRKRALCDCGRPAAKDKARCQRCESKEQRRSQFARVLHLGPKARWGRRTCSCCDALALPDKRWCKAHEPVFEGQPDLAQIATRREEVA
jgi:hypothetical protein